MKIKDVGILMFYLPGQKKTITNFTFDKGDGKKSFCTCASDYAGV